MDQVVSCGNVSDVCTLGARFESGRNYNEYPNLEFSCFSQSIQAVLGCYFLKLSITQSLAAVH
jgi:hypothetical protein